MCTRSSGNAVPRLSEGHVGELGGTDADRGSFPLCLEVCKGSNLLQQRLCDSHKHCETLPLRRRARRLRLHQRRRCCTRSLPDEFSQKMKGTAPWEVKHAVQTQPKSSDRAGRERRARYFRPQISRERLAAPPDSSAKRPETKRFSSPPHLFF